MPNIRPLPPDLQERAKQELGEVPERIDEDLQHIKDWLKKQPHLTPRTDDQFLIAFLRGCKYSLERAKEKLDAFYSMRTAMPEFYTDRDPMDPEIQELLGLGLILILPGVDDQGRRVLIQRMGNYNPEKHRLEPMFKMSSMMWDIMLQEEDYGLVNGFVMLGDMAGTTLAHMRQMQPVTMKKMMTCFQEGHPIRVKAMHHIHLPHFFEKMMNFFKTFMKEKLQRRIFIHGDDLESLYGIIPKRILPKEYGGDGPTAEEITAEWKKKVESYRDFFLEDPKFRCNEKKRPGRPKTQEDLFGLEGSFRQLSFD